MTNVTPFPDKIAGAPNIAVTLTGTEWLAIALKLAGRDHHPEDAVLAESKMLRQMGGAK